MEKKKLKKPRITEETSKFIEVEVPEGKFEEYDLDGYELVGNGQDFEGNYYEYYCKYKSKDVNSKPKKEVRNSSHA